MAEFGVDNLSIPNRFESLLGNPDLTLEPLIIPVGTDMRRLLSIRDRTRVQRSGVLAFLLGDTDIGKTTAIYSLGALPRVPPPES